MLYQTNNVVTDLPMVIYACMGKDIPSKLRLSQIVLATSQWMLLQALTYDDNIISSWGRFRAFMKGANFTDAAEEITDGEIESLETAMKQNSSCGGDLKSLTDRVWMTVNEYREGNPAITDDELRLKISESDLVQYDVAIVTNNCMQHLISESSVETAYKTRETLRKTFGVIINDLIKSGKSDNGTSLDEKMIAYKWIDAGLSTISASMIDPTDIATLLSEQFEFWVKKGDGQVIINFTSTDTKDVTVNIMSGGDKIDELDVVAGGNASWKSTIAVLGGKTLYLDRWRPGFLGLPGTGGGSLVLWVPRAAMGGHLEIEVKLNVS
ncbi:unnamed protein product [Phytophthora fragariaefolia]|uniref:Unnamed protein product n=1 Tax=Phytophthora fragariaefolia TaxID=1490495 RepID=A0A9W6U0P8_9STRA|nr:unnamed protein product [Phytophthora fragariaefolia]